MVKTIRSSISLEDLRTRLIQYCRELPSYTRVATDGFDVHFTDRGIRIELREPKEEKCWYCDGVGKDHDWEGGVKKYKDEPCPYCGGTGKQKVYSSTSALLVPKEKRNGEKVAIQVNVPTTDTKRMMEEVNKIKSFIEGLVGKPCVRVPLNRKEKVALMKPLDELLEASVEKIRDNGGEDDGRNAL